MAEEVTGPIGALDVNTARLLMEKVAAMDEATQAAVMEEVKSDLGKMKVKLKDDIKSLKEMVKYLGEDKMADVVTVPTGDGLFGMGSGGGMIGGLILGSLLRNNGNLFGNGYGDGVGPAAGAVLRSPPEQVQANMSLMQAVGAVDKAVAVSTAAMEASQANQTIGLTSQLNSITSSLAGRVEGVKDVVNAGTMVLAQQLNGVEKSIMENRYELAKDIVSDGDKTRALLTAQYEASLNRQLSDANAQIIALQTRADTTAVSRGVEVNTTNNINQMQQQQQQQQNYDRLAGLIWSLGQQIRSNNEAINVGSGTLTASPTNTNTNIR